MLANGFHTGHGHMRQPQDIKSALALSSIIFQANQNMHGGQSFAIFDIDLAPYVRKQLRDIKRLQSYPLTKEQIEEFAWKETENDTYQACEAFVHNSNSMHSRAEDKYRLFLLITEQIHQKKEEC